MSKLIIITIVAMATLGSIVWTLKRPSRVLQKPGQVQVIFYNHGAPSPLDLQSSYTNNILLACQNALTSSDVGHMLRLTVSAETIEGIKRNELSIEIIYP